MGYTHYWTVNKPLTQAQFDDFRAYASSVLYEERDLLAERVVDDSEISFNGLGANAHETFWLAINSIDFNFCKTARKPYDAAVVACL